MALMVLVVIGKSQDVEVQNNTPDGVEFIEFVFDDTITKIGADFFRMFYSDWENPTEIKGLSIYVGERPMPGIGTMIWVKVEQQYTYRAFLRPNLEQIRQGVQQAIMQTDSYFENYESIQQQLDSDDFSGTGIF